MHTLTTVTQIFKSFLAIGKNPGGLLALKWKKIHNAKKMLPNLHLKQL